MKLKLALAIALLSLLVSPNFLLGEPAPSNPITASPPVSRPSTPHCIVTLLNNQPFGPIGDPRGLIPFIGTYTPPAGCAAPWSKVVLDVDFHVDAGRQFDRVGALWLGNVEIFRTITAEPSKTFGPDWHVEKDVSIYSAVFVSNQTLAAVVSNFVTRRFTSTIFETATLTFYKIDAHNPESPHADMVVPVSRTPGSSNGPWFQIFRGATRSASVTLPRNLVQTFLDVYASPHSCDEFWYSNQPTDYAVANGLCGGSAFREIRILLDGKLAGVVWPFPFIYTGGINPFLWRPIPAVNTFNLPAYRINLTPFLANLTDGQTHAISFTIMNNFNYWLIDGDLLLFRDPQLTATSAVLTTYQAPPAPAEEISRNVNENSALFRTTASRSLLFSGSVTTSRGTVATTIQQTFDFTNDQVLNLINGRENLRGTETITTTTTVTHARGTSVVTSVSDSYPIAVTSAFIIPVGNSEEIEFILPATVHQALLRSITLSVNGATTFTSTLSDTIHATAILVRAADGTNIAANGATSEVFIATDSTGFCFNHLLKAAQGTVTVDLFRTQCP